MSDLLRIVTLSAGGRPVEVLDLDDGDGYTRVRDSFAFQPGPRATRFAARTRRYGGARAVGETHANGAISWDALVAGTTADQVAQRVEALLSEIEDAARGRYIEWRPDGVSSERSSYLDVAGPGSWTPSYRWVQFAGARSMQVTIQVPVLPLVRWAPCTIADDFAVDSVADYTFDAGSASIVAVGSGVLSPNGSLTTERRMAHTARGYEWLGGQATIKAIPGATLGSFRAGVLLRRSATTTYVECYVDDDGTTSRLRIDVVIAGTRTNRASVNLGSRITDGAAFWVRGRIEDDVVYAEHFTSAPTPLGTPTTSSPSGGAGYTLTSGEQDALVAGTPGITWTPMHASATLGDFAFVPYVRRAMTLPDTLALADNVPGTAPALADVEITHSGGANAPVFALIGWAPRPRTPLAGVAPFGILEAEDASDLGGWAVAADASARGGSALVDAAVAGVESYTASWVVDPSAVAPDEFADGEVSLEVWGRVLYSSSTVTPRMTVSLRPVDGTSFGAEHYTNEWGAAGKLLVVPPSGTLRTIVRFGTLTARVDRLNPRALKLWLAASTGAGSTGSFGLDYLLIVPSRARCLSPTGKENDASYPSFIASTSQTTKRIRSDLSALTASPPNAPTVDHGLGGSLIEPPPGELDLLAKLSSHVPDDPTTTAADEQLSHSATVALHVVPRSHMFRSA